MDTKWDTIRSEKLSKCLLLLCQIVDFDARHSRHFSKKWFMRKALAGETNVPPTKAVHHFERLIR